MFQVYRYHVGKFGRGSLPSGLTGGKHRSVSGGLISGLRGELGDQGEAAVRMSWLAGAEADRRPPACRGGWPPASRRTPWPPAGDSSPATAPESKHWALGI